MIAYKLKRSNLVGLILAETSMVWMSFIVSKLLCRKSSSSSSIIPNFYLGSQPSGIPLIFARVAFWFSTHQGTLYCLSFSFSFSLMLFFVLFFFLFTPSLLSLFFFFFRYGYRKGFNCFNLPPFLSTPTSLGTLRTVDFNRMI